MMHMTFYWSRYATLLFDSWKTDSWTSYALALLACIIASVFYQYMEERRIRFKLLAGGKSSPSSETEVPLIHANKSRLQKFPAAKLAGAALFGVNSAIGYMLMLAVMSFNGGVFVAIVVGLSIGYFVFRSDGDENLTVVVDSPCACA